MNLPETDVFKMKHHSGSIRKNIIDMHNHKKFLVSHELTHKKQAKRKKMTANFPPLKTCQNNVLYKRKP